MLLDQLKPNIVVRGPIFPEPVQVITTLPMGAAVKLIGKGLNTGQVHEPILNAEQLAQLACTADREPFDGDPLNFRLGIEAMRLALAYEYDPYFSLSIARVDPLPHQLEAVYDYFLKMPRIRFLLADDPGAGKTIMAGLLHKELKIRGLVKRTLIVTPANLSFQWQREMKDKFREKFEVIRGDVLRANYGQNPWQEKNQVITSVSWVSRIEDANESLLRSQWDLIIVDEAHKMSAASADKKTLAYELGEELSEHDRPLPADDGHAAQRRSRRTSASSWNCWTRTFMATFTAWKRPCAATSAPFYLRRTKEALVTFPDPETGRCKQALHRPRRPDRRVPDRQRGVGLLRRPDAVTSMTSRSRPRPTIPRGPGARASRWRCSSAGSLPASTPSAAAWSACATSGKRSWTIPRLTAKSRSRKSSPTILTICRKRNSRGSYDELEEVVASVDPAALQRRNPQIGRLIDQAPRLGEAGDRVQAGQAPGSAHQLWHLQRPEDETTHLHRAQGHARLPGR